MGDTVAEILMTNDGSNLDKWFLKIQNEKQRIDFALNMLSQTLLGLREMHEIGYSHGDLKLDNICCRLS